MSTTTETESEFAFGTVSADILVYKASTFLRTTPVPARIDGRTYVRLARASEAGR